MSKLINLKDKLGNILYSKDILEQGAKDNVNYVKYANGVLICWGYAEIGVIGSSKRDFTKDITLPVAYKDNDYNVVITTNHKGGYWADVVVGAYPGNNKTVNMGAYFRGSSGQTESFFGAYFSTIGFWK